MAVGVLAGGCATLDTSVTRPDSQAVQLPYTESRLGQLFDADLARRPGESASLLLDEGTLALFQRGVLADSAERGIDLQTYIYDDDDSGIVMMERLFLAAERGVRVRVLIDDNGLASDTVLPLILDDHPQIEVRIFNPFHLRARWSRPFQYLFEFRRLNRRMHNKLLIVDGTAVIVGGRNVGGNYFDQDDDANFTDLDALLVGPVAREAADCFDEYWNSEYAVPAAAVPNPLSEKRRERLIETYRARLSALDDRRDRYEALRDAFLEALEQRQIDVHWGPARLVADPPDKVDPSATPEPSPVLAALRDEWDRATREILIASAYLVPGPDFSSNILAKREQGVAVSLLTNSLASNDVAVVHAGYAKRRRELLESGARLFEYQKFANTPSREDTPSSGASLHSKTIVFDRHHAWIGSFNLDPRSVELNTEVAVIVDSASLAAELAQRLEHDMSPERSWEVHLRRDPGAQRAHLEWHGIHEGESIVVRHEPDTSPLERAAVQFFKLIPGLDRLL